MHINLLTLTLDLESQIYILFPVVDYVGVHAKLNFKEQYYARYIDLTFTTEYEDQGQICSQ